MPNGPRVAFKGVRLRFVDAAGREWTVYDVRRVGGRIRRTGLAGSAATWRVFVGANGKRHAYRFGPGEPRELEPERLAQQLNAAVWAGTFQPNRRSRR